MHGCGIGVVALRLGGAHHGRRPAVYDQCGINPAHGPLSGVGLATRTALMQASRIAMWSAMSTQKTTAADAFTPGERDYIRRELDRFFSTLPSVADGFQIRTWRGGAQAGQPKVPLAAKGLLERALMRLEPAPWPPRLFFTDAGLAALRIMMADRRFADPKTFAHVRQELGIDPVPDET